jgi:hypothetical protein
MAVGDRFEKDFGYLLPFLDRVQEASGELSDQGAAVELRALLAEEKARWTRIRQLLGGGQGMAPATGVASANAQAPTHAPADDTAQQPSASQAGGTPPLAPAGFTVGSLRSRSSHTSAPDRDRR